VAQLFRSGYRSAYRWLSRRAAGTHRSGGVVADLLPRKTRPRGCSYEPSGTPPGPGRRGPERTRPAAIRTRPDRARRGGRPPLPDHPPAASLLLPHPQLQPVSCQNLSPGVTAVRKLVPAGAAESPGRWPGSWLGVVGVDADLQRPAAAQSPLRYWRGRSDRAALPRRRRNAPGAAPGRPDQSGWSW
jgi:hypothetical protein